MPIILRELSPKLANLNTYFMDGDKNHIAKFDKNTVVEVGFTDKASVEKLLHSLDEDYEVYLKEPEKKGTRNPGAPFTTDALYSSASTYCGMSVKMAKATAQRLFEGIKLKGKHVSLITYPRTDSMRVSSEFVAKAKTLITKEFGTDSYVYRDYSKIKVKKANVAKTQDGHEAIRVTDPFIRPDELKTSIGANEYKLYKLI